MEDLSILQKGFVAFMDGLWWGLRDTVGALSMYEGYANGFKQAGKEIAEAIGGRGPTDAAKIAATIMTALGLTAEAQGKEVVVKSCPLWERIRERGLEYAFHVEEICWKPLLEGIGEKVGAKPVVTTSLRLAYVERAKAEYKKSKAKRALDAKKISEDDYKKQIEMLDKSIEHVVDEGRYGFE
ncbi:MAG: hypothetical protein ACTSYL_03080 [Candidatus Thorarchaeota archaeon]